MSNPSRHEGTFDSGGTDSAGISRTSRNPKSLRRDEALAEPYERMYDEMMDWQLRHRRSRRQQRGSARIARMADVGVRKHRQPAAAASPEISRETGVGT